MQNCSSSQMREAVFCMLPMKISCGCVHVWRAVYGPGHGSPFTSEQALKQMQGFPLPGVTPNLLPWKPNLVFLTDTHTHTLMDWPGCVRTYMGCVHSQRHCFSLSFLTVNEESLGFFLCVGLKKWAIWSHLFGLCVMSIFHIFFDHLWKEMIN